ncbi:hypothetical protein [Streptomyces sp. NPDC057238]|uniref:hypothetical protein n=1 Tax=Streptomyces sp. NPDC057238 TaxID=3346060 RepID=UPI00362E4D0B
MNHGGAAGLSADIDFIARDFTGREWLLPRIARWLDDPTSQKFLLVTGPPGVGKTALCAWLSGAGPVPDGAAGELLRRIRKRWNSFQFCSRRLEGASIDPRSYVRRLATDLASSTPAYAHAVLRAISPPLTRVDINVGSNLGRVVGVHTDHLWITGRSIMDGFSESIKMPVELLAREAPDVNLAILVDGLDEALTGGGTSIPHLIASMSDLPGNVKVLISAKTDRRIRDLFPNQTDVIDLADPGLEPYSRQDVLSFVERRLARELASADHIWQPDRIARAAGVNFQYARHLLDEMKSGNIDNSPRIPEGLSQLYSSYLDQLIPESGEYGQGDAVLQNYLPLLELLSVVLAPIAVDRVALILDWPIQTVSTRIDELQQLIEFGHENSDIRFFHSSMAEFVGVSVLPDRTPNRYHAPAREMHAKIARSYVDRYSQGSGGSHGSWHEIDRYGLNYLAEHMRSGIGVGLLEPDDLYDLAIDPEYRRAQTATGSIDAMLQTATVALEHALESNSSSATAKLIEAFAIASEPQLHGLAANALSRMSPELRKDEILRLLFRDETRQIALNAAYQLGFAAEELFQEMALTDHSELPRMVAYMAYLKWLQGEHEIVMRFTEKIAREVRIQAPRDARRRLAFLADVTIILYINLAHDYRLIQWADGLWWELLTRKLHVRKFNHRLIGAVVTSVAANTISQRLGEAVMVDAMQSPSVYFHGGQKPRELLGRAVDLLDPHSDLRGEYNLLAELLGSDIAFLRVIGAIVLSSHCSRSLHNLKEFLAERYTRLPPRARLWHLIAFGVLAPTETDWSPFVAWQTEYLLRNDRATIVSRDAGAMRSLNLVLLPLGLACGKAGAPMVVVETALRDALTVDDSEYAVALVEALGVVGIYYPDQTLSAFQLVPNTVGGAVGSKIIDSLAILNVLHPQAVDLFLEETGRGHLRMNVRSKVNVVNTRRIIDQVGFFNSAIYQAAHNPIMRERLTKPALRCLNESYSVKQFAKRYTRILLQLARDYDFHPGAWAAQE